MEAITLDTKEFTVTIGDTTHSVEPKMMDVLLYLHQQRDEYVSTQELHDNVWDGVYVTDAAIRRAIAKLRQLLGDNAKDPKYIKSVPKRGYKLIASVVIESKAQLAPSKTTKELSVRSPSLIPFVAISLVGLIALWVLLTNIKSETKPRSTSVKSLNALPGSKLSITLAEQGRLAYTVKNPGTNKYEIVLGNTHNTHLRTLVENLTLPASLVFDDDASNLFYVDTNNTSAVLHSVSLASRQIKTWIDGFYLIADMDMGWQPNSLLFLGKLTNTSPLRVYQFDLETQQFTALNQFQDPSINPYRLSRSPSGTELLTGRYNEQTKVHSISVTSLQNGQRRYNKNYENSIFDVQWTDSDHILVLTETGLEHINLIEKTSNRIEAPSSLTSIAMLDKESILAIQRQSPNPRVFEFHLDGAQLSVDNIIDIPASVTSLHATQQPDRYIAVSKKGNQSFVELYDERDKQFTPIYQSNSNVTGLTASMNNALFLLVKEQQLCLLDLKTGELVALTSGDTLLGSGDIDQDANYIYYTQKLNGDWQVFKQHIKSGVTDIIASGFADVKVTGGDNLVFVRPDGQLFYYNSQRDAYQALPYNVYSGEGYFWNARKASPTIVWTEHTFENTILRRLDLSDEKAPILEEYQISRASLEPKFSFSEVKGTLLMRYNEGNDSAILQLSPLETKNIKH